MVYPLGTVTQQANVWQEVITASGTWTAPTVATNGFTVILKSIKVVGTGGSSANSGTLNTNGASGSGGGAYSDVIASLPGTTATGSWTATDPAPASNTVGGDVWFSNTGSAPTTVAQGALAKGGGKGAASAGAAGAGGLASGGVGDTKFSGGNGAVGALSAGGGGGGGAGTAGVGGNASGATGGTGQTPGGNGGNGGSGATTAGQPYGGGGGGANGLGNTSGLGAQGVIILTYTKQFATSQPAQSEWFTPNLIPLLTLKKSDVSQSEWFPASAIRIQPLIPNAQSEWFPKYVIKDSIAQQAFSEWYVAAANIKVSPANQQAFSEWFAKYALALQPSLSPAESEWFAKYALTLIPNVPKGFSEWFPRASICLPTTGIPSGACPSDYSPNDGLKKINGVVYDHENGGTIAGATVCLVRDSDALQVSCVNTAADGSYSFPRGSTDPNTYHVVVSYTSGGVQQMGMSKSGCVPS